MPECRYVAIHFSGQGKIGGARELQKNISSKIQEKNARQGKILEFFLLGNIKTTFWMEHIIQRRTQSGPFSIPFSPSCAPVSMVEFPWISLKTLEQTVMAVPGLWIYLIILNVRQAFEDVLGSKCVRILNMARFYMQGLCRVPNISEYGSVCLNNVWLCLNTS